MADKERSMNEETRQRKYLDGLRLICEAFDTLREPLNVDERDSVFRPEVQVAYQLTESRDKLRELIAQRQRQGIKAA
jgi:hypothetical protein